MICEQYHYFYQSFIMFSFLQFVAFGCLNSSTNDEVIPMVRGGTVGIESELAGMEMGACSEIYMGEQDVTCLSTNYQQE